MVELIKKTAEEFKLDWKALTAFITVESGGRGFDTVTGKLIIQFEPVWFRRKDPYAPSGKWSLNGVERQRQEWIAFNDAFNLNPDAAMQATSIGLAQILGLHYNRLGYETVGDMWDDAKKGLDRQIWQLAKFITTDANLLKALRIHDWEKVAGIYNGPKFREIAVKYKRVPYDIAMRTEYYKLAKQ